MTYAALVSAVVPGRRHVEPPAPDHLRRRPRRQPLARGGRSGYCLSMRISKPAGAAALATSLLLLLVVPTAASAGVGIGTSMTLPSATAIGQQGLAGSFSVTNVNTPPNNTESNVVNSMRLALSCGAAGTAGNPCPTPDPGVYAVDSPASGAAGTSCAGSSFTVSAPDASGTVTFTRVGGAPVLPPPGGTNTCTVNFTFDVLQMPTIDVDGGTTGTQTRSNFRAIAQGQISGLVVESGTSGVRTVTKAAATVTTNASDGVVGGQITDTATVESDVPAGVTGTVTFTLYGPGDTNCTGSPVFTSLNRPINGSGVAVSAPYTPPATGNYRWRASYSGDVNHVPISALCNEANETSFVGSAPLAPKASGTPARGDFNGDGIGDLAIGAPGEDYASATDPGTVHVLYGSASGASSAGSQYWSQDSAGIADGAENGDRFGSALTAGDFNGDGRDDLVVGAPGEDIGGALVDAGVVHVIYGSATGLVSAGSQLWSQNTGSIVDAAETGDHFGSTLTVGKFNSDALADLVIGVPDESVGAVAGAGAVHVLPGAASGLTDAGAQLWSQNSAAIADSAEDGDRFGSSLAAGDMNSSAGQDLAIGAPGEDGAVVNIGVVHVLYGSASGLASAGSQLWSQDSAGIGDSAEVGDSFGTALAVGKLDTDAFGDLVVGVPEENVGPIGDDGLVHVIRGASTGLTAAGSQVWTQDTAGIADSVETGDGFGATLAVGDMNNTAGQDLAIGVPGEDVGSIVDAGVAHVIFGSATGLVSAGSQLWSQNSASIADSAETGDRFGSALAAGKLNTDGFAELVVGVPDESVGAVAGAGVVHVLPGTATGVTGTGSQLWSQNSPGIADSVEVGDSFGAALGA